MAQYNAIIDDRAGAPTHGKWVVTHADGPRVGCLAVSTGYASRDSAMRKIRTLRVVDLDREIGAPTCPPAVVTKALDPTPSWVGVYPAVPRRAYRHRRNYL